MIATATATLDNIFSDVADVWAPKPKVTTSEFIENNVSLAPEFEGSGGQYQIDPDSPFWREPIDAFHDPDVESITSLKSTQVGGTLAVIALILATAELDPAPSMLVVPTQDEAKLYRDRVYADAEVSTSVISSKVPPERLRNLASIDLETCQTYLAWAGSKQRVRGKPCKYVFLSEIDVYKTDKGISNAGDVNRAAERRTDRFPSSTIMRESTPVGEHSRIASFYDASDQRRWWCDCPHCGRAQIVRFFPLKGNDGRGGFAGYKDPQSGELLDEDTARKRAHYICEHNGCKITNEYKRLFIRTGRWVPKGQRIDEHGQLVGKPERSGRKRGYHFWQVMNHKKTFGDIACTWVDHKNDGTIREFFQDVLGFRFVAARSIPTYEKVALRLRYPNKKGQVPHRAWFLTCGCDMQLDRIYYSVRGWAPGRTSWLVDWGEFMRDEAEIEYQDEMSDDDLPANIELASDLKQIEQLVARQYPVVNRDGESVKNPRGHCHLPIRMIGIDGNYRTSQLHDFLVERDRPERIRAVRGDNKLDPTTRYRCNVVEANTRTGKPYEGGLELWGLYVNFWKQLVFDRLSGSGEHFGAFHVTSDVLEHGEKYMRQLCNEPPTEVINEKTGRKEIRFKPRDTRVGVDFWDTTIYSEAIADMVVGDLGWSESVWMKDLNKGKSKKTRSTNKRQSSILER